VSDAPPLYHGTRRGFGSGGWLFPRDFHHSTGTTAPVNSGHAPAPDASGWVYATESLDLAWAYAYAAVGRGRPKVLVVEPHGRIEPDPEHSADMQAWRFEFGRVTAILTEPTITEIEAYQGWVIT
jgi:hypothetical protein